MYLESLAEIVQVLTATVGAGRALRVLGLAHPLAPPDEVTEFDSQMQLTAHLESQKQRSDKELRDLTLHSLERVETFL